MDFAEMAAQFFNRVGQIGLGVALVGGVVNSALYNGKGPIQIHCLSRGVSYLYNMKACLVLFIIVTFFIAKLHKDVI